MVVPTPCHSPLHPVQSVTDQYALMAGSSSAVTQPDKFIDLPVNISSAISKRHLPGSLTSRFWALD